MTVGQAVHAAKLGIRMMQILKHRDLVDVPWKNGGGITRSIAKGVVENAVVWTISRADVAQDGPFSDFVGMERILTIVSGGAMRLDTPASSLEAKLWAPVRFDGGLKINSHLADGSLTDLNLMFDPLRCTGDVVVRRGPLEQDAASPESGLLAYHVLSGGPTVDDNRLSNGDTIFCDDVGAVVELDEADALLEIRLTYLDQSEAIKLSIATR